MSSRRRRGDGQRNWRDLATDADGNGENLAGSRISRMQTSEIEITYTHVQRADVEVEVVVTRATASGV